MKRTLTAIVPTYNEERNIQQCLESLTWADELLVVDSFSTDNTMNIVKKHADTILEHEYGYSAKQKNWAIPQAQHEWILLLDADEICTPELHAEIESILNADNEPPHGAYWIYRRNHFLGKEIKHCHWNHDRVIRLFKRDNYSYEDFMVHAELQPQDNIGILHERLLHFPYRDLDDYFKKLMRYTPWGAKKAIRKGMKGSLINVIINPAWEFFRRYIIYAGFLDGSRGLLISLTSMAMILFRYIKAWELVHVHHMVPGEKHDTDMEKTS